MQPALDIPDPESIRDSLDLADPQGELPLMILIPLAVLLVIAIGFGIRWLVRRRRARLGSARQIAAEKLWRIEPETISARELFRELHSILVEYLTERGGFAAAQQTSPEILGSFEAAGLGDSRELRTFLSASDRARFSPAAPSATGREPVMLCRAIIDHVEAQRKGGRSRREV